MKKAKRRKKKMAQERIYGGMWIPAPPPFNAAVPAFSSILMDATSEKVAFIFEVPKTGTLDKFEFRIGASTQLPVNGLKVSFQLVGGATGDPEGTASYYRVVTGMSANSWVVPGLMTDDGTDTGVKSAAVRGTMLACVIEFQSFSASDVVNVSTLDLSSTSILASPTYADHYTAAWAKQARGMVMALKYDDGTYEYIHSNIYPIKDLWVGGQEGEAVDFAFSLPTDALLGGVYARMETDASINDVLFVTLTRESDGEVVNTYSRFSLFQVSTAAQYYFFRFASDILIRANEVYIITIYADTGSSSISFYGFEVNSEEIMASAEGGENLHVWDTPNQAHVTTKRPWMGLLITGVDHDISGGSGGPGWEGVP